MILKPLLKGGWRVTAEFIGYLYHSLGILEPLGEDELEQIYISIQHIEKITQDEDGMLYITVDEPTLKAHLVVRLDNWKERSDLKEFGRYESRGVI